MERMLKSGTIKDISTLDNSMLFTGSAQAGWLSKPLRATVINLGANAQVRVSALVCLFMLDLNNSK